MSSKHNDQYFITEAIKFFTKLICKRREKLGIDTRPVNFAGNIGRQMKREVKQWFLTKYPNNCDYIKFFLQNDSVFHYDRITGDVYMNTGAEELFRRPERLAQLEEIHVCSDDLDMYQMSQYVFELEFFIVVFKIFEESYSLKRTYQLKTCQLSQHFSDSKFDEMFETLDHILTKPEVNNTLEFETDLMSYLNTNYSEVFEVNKQNKTIKFHLKIIESLKKVNETIDDTTYKLFECLLVKYLETNGSKDVDLVFNAINKRHPFIVGHIFRQSVITGDDYTLIDFCKQFGETFEISLVDKNDGRIERLIKLRKAEAVLQNKEKDPSEDQEVYVSEEDETYTSDDEIYNSDDECIQSVKV